MCSVIIATQVTSFIFALGLTQQTWNREEEIFMSRTIEGISIPDTKMAREATGFIRDTEYELFFNHSAACITGRLWRGRREESKPMLSLCISGVYSMTLA